MKIGFDVSQTGSGKAGCGYYADGLIRALEALGSGDEFWLYPAFGDVFWDPCCATAAYSTDNPRFRRLKAPASFEESQRFWAGPPGPDLEARIGSPDLVHSNNFFCPRGLKKARLVYTLYDLSFLEEPSWSTEANRVGCLDGVFRAAVSADWIVTDSEYTRRHFLKVFPHFFTERTGVVYPASRYIPEDVDLKWQKYGLPERFGHLERGGFWLSVGSLEPRKNHRRLLEAYARSGSPLPLVLAGGKGWLMDDFTGGRPGVEITGYASDAELEWLYRNCFAFLYPSLFEGFGMPVVEAMSLGAPVICSSTTSLPEVAGDAALLVDPLDAGAIAGAMRRLASGEIGRENLRAAGVRQAARFSWEASARKLLEIYRECAARPPAFAKPPGPGVG